MQRVGAAGSRVSLAVVGAIALAPAPFDCDPNGWGRDGNPTIPVVIELDPTFGEGGRRTFDVLGDGVFLDSETARGVAPLPDGRIALVGGSTEAFFQAYGVVAVLDENGDLDPSFGDGGIVVESFAQDTYFSSLAVDSEGRLVIGGRTSASRYDPPFAMVVRYLPDGTRDSSFGTDPNLVGVTRVAHPCRVSLWDIALQTDGAIVGTGGAACDTVQTSVAMRFSAAGALDASFGDQGTALLDEGTSGEVVAWSQGNGASGILVGSTVGPVGFDGARDFSLTQLTHDGERDASFGNDGSVVTDFGDGTPGRNEGLAALTRISEGAFLAAGNIQWLSNFEQPWQYSYDLLVAKYQSDGALDLEFGTDGWVAVDMGDTNESVIEVLRRTNNNIVLVGESGGADWDKYHSIVHLRTFGQLAPGEPKTITAEEGLGIRVKAAALDSEGRLLVGGAIRVEMGGSSHAVWRYRFRELD